MTADDLPAAEPDTQQAAEPAPAPGPVCRICATPREDGQDWCLACGTAFQAPRRLGSLRSLGAATAATLVLMSGAAVASVAAIGDDKPGAPTVVATVSTAAPAVPTETTPTIDTSVQTPVEPLPVDTPTTTPAVTPTSTGTTVTATSTTKDPGTPKDTRVVLTSGSGALYDPLARAKATGDPQRAIDGDPGTSWFVTTPPDGDMNVGYLLDLGEETALKRLEVFTKTPGMALRVMGATTADPPPSLSDSGWTELAQMPDAGLDDNGKPRPSKQPVKITLETHGKKFRLIVITIETPPTSGSTARFTELRLFS